jgi:mono/diheme cytochrome c family protein
MRRLIGVGVVALGVAFSGAAYASADGATIFKSKCSPCHGSEGAGTTMAPAFKGNEFVKTSAEDVIGQTIKGGRSAKANTKKYKNFALDMPAQTLSDDELKAVIGYLKSVVGK